MATRTPSLARWAGLSAALILALSGGSARADEADKTGAAPKTSSGPVFGYDLDKGAFIRTADGAWELNPYAMVQIQNVSRFEAGATASTSFVLRSAKLIFHGHMFHPSLTYHFQINAGDSKVAAEDIYFRWNPTPWFGVLAGQFEVPFNRQHITLEAYQQLIDRSLADQRFNLQRDIGAAVYLNDPARRFEATVGVWNGARQNNVNDDGNYMTSVRLSYNPFGPIAFREADLDYSLSPKLSIAVAGAYNPTRTVVDSMGATPTYKLTDVMQGVGELTFRYRGVSLTGEAHVRRQIRDGAPKVDQGVFAQAGVFVIPKHLELIGRVSALSGEVGPKDVTREVTGGAAYYLHGHRFKVQADYGYLLDHSDNAVHRLRFQVEAFL